MKDSRLRHIGFALWELLMLGIYLTYPNAPDPIANIVLGGAILGFVIWGIFWLSYSKRHDTDNHATTATHTSKHDIWLSDAVYFIAYRTWKAVNWLSFQIPEKMNKIETARKELLQEAKYGNITIWGKENFGSDLVDINPEYWEQYYFDFFDVLSVLTGQKDKENLGTKPTSILSSRIYKGLKVTKGEIEKIWPQ